MNISRMIRGAAVAAVALVAFAFTSDSAQAQHYGHGYGRAPSCNTGYGNFNRYNTGYRPGLSISVGNFNRGISFGYSSYQPLYQRSYYHNTTHWDYHPGGVVRHGNHYDYIPGHYDLHRTGHWHH